jgi:hypothetical protein
MVIAKLPPPASHTLKCVIERNPNIATLCRAGLSRYLGTGSVKESLCALSLAPWEIIHILEVLVSSPERNESMVWCPLAWCLGSAGHLRNAGVGE